MSNNTIYNYIILVTLLSATLFSCKAQNESRQTPAYNPNATIVPYQNPEPTDQIAEYIRNIIEDTDGNLWMGTNGYGLVRYDGNEVKYFQIKDGLIGMQVTNVIQASDGNIWITTDGGVSVYDGKSFTNYTVKDGLRDEWVWSVYEDSKGQIWVSSSQGTSRFVDGRFVDFDFKYKNPFREENRFSEECVRDFIERDGKLYMGTTGLGVVILDGNDLTFLNTENGLCDNRIDDLMLDKNNHLWVGTRNGGVCRYDGEKFKTFDTNNGIENDEVIAVYQSKDGDIWFSSEGYGVYRYDGTDSLKNYAKNEGLGVRAVQTIFEDSQGRFWTGGGGGLYRLVGNSFVNVTKEGPWH